MLSFFATQFGFSLILMGVLIGIIMLCVAYCILLERKIAAWIQDRIGPNRVGPKGLLQPIADGVKFLLKEDIISANVDRPIFILAPCLAFIVATIGFAVIPWGGRLDLGGEQPVLVQVASVDIGLLYVLAVGSLGVYGVVLGGWASNNKFSFYGGMRATAQMLSYEIPMGLAILVVVLTCGQLRLEGIVETQIFGAEIGPAGRHVGGAWNALLHPVAFIVLVITAFAETNRTPFDLAEAEQELIGGYQTEYSSMKMALFYLGEYAHMITVSAFMAVLFLGGWELFPFSERLGWSWLHWLNADTGLLAAVCRFAIMFGKVAAFIVLFMVVRWTLPRFRFDQLMRLAWRGLVPVGILLVTLAGVLAYLGRPISIWATLGNVAIVAVILAYVALSKGPITGRQANLPPVPGSMVRRTTSALLVLLLLLPAATARAANPTTTQSVGPLSREQIIREADPRIRRFRTGEAVVRLMHGAKPISAGESVDIRQTRHAFLFGSNIFKLNGYQDEADNAAYAKHFAELLNFATLPFYWWGYEPKQGEPTYERTEAILAWCKERNVTTKGHPLAWNWRDPKWLPSDPEAAMDAQMARIERDVRRFRGQIGIWDVVNEATHYDRDTAKQQSPVLTAGIEKLSVGEYVRSAFRAARRANPDAVLIINDYRTDPAYIEKVISQLVDESGRPLYDVIGIQSHQHGGAWKVETIWEVCERFAVFGKPLHFTETTFLSGELGWNLREQRGKDFKWESTPEGEQRQAEQVATFYTTLFSHPAVEAITWWDFADKNSWQGAPAGLLREDMTPKPAYERLKQLVKDEWWTETRAEVSSKGEARFRGFFGRYEVTVRTADATLTGMLTFDKTTAGPIEVHLK